MDAPALPVNASLNAGEVTGEPVVAEPRKERHARKAKEPAA